MTGDEILSLMRLGIFDRGKPADREIMLNLLDKPEETPMTWDGQPEHRNLGGDGEQPKTAGDYRREIAGWLGSRPQPAPLGAAEYIREQAGQASQKPPGPGEMPPDPFNSIAGAAVAQVEIFRAVTGADLTEPQALYYPACLVHVGRAMQDGHMLGQMPPEPP